MPKIITKCKNDLAHYRRRLGFSRAKVLRLLGEARRARVGEYEVSKSMPTLRIALRLSAIYRVPVEFLYRELYLSQQESVRSLEATLPQERRNMLPELAR